MLLGHITLDVIFDIILATGFLSYRACNRVNQVVQSIKVPNYTLLGKHQSQVNYFPVSYAASKPRITIRWIRTGSQLY